MKFLVHLSTRPLHKDAIVDADSHEAALKQAESENAGYHAGVVAVITEMDGSEVLETEDERELFASCESCNKLLWDDSEAQDCGDGYLCLPCFESASKQWTERVNRGVCGECGKNPKQAHTGFCTECEPE